MATRMQQRRGTAAEWATVNPVLADGEVGFVRDTSEIKIGNGVDAWSVLPSAYVKKAGGDTIAASGAAIVPLTLKTIAGQTANAFEIQDSAGTVVVNSDLFGNVKGKAFAASGILQAGSKTLDETQQTFVNIETAARKGLVVRGAVTQTGNLSEFQDSAGTVLASVDNVGAFRGNAFAASGLLQAGTSTLDDTQQALVSIGSDGRKGLVVRGASAQAANLAEFQNSAGAVLARLTSAGRLVVNESSYFGTGADATISDGTVRILPMTTASRGLVVQALVGQTAHLLEFRNSAGAYDAYVSAAGSVQAHRGLGVYPSAADQEGIVVYARASQAGPLIQLRNSAGAELYALTSTGVPRYSSANSYTTSGGGGTASALPANPVGYIGVVVAGTFRRIPYYA